MSTEQWNTERQSEPPVSWDSNENSFTIVIRRTKQDGSEETLEAEWRPPVLSVVRIREKKDVEWGPGVVLPVTSCRFVGLKPNTEYEAQLSELQGEHERVVEVISVRTNPEII